MRMTDQGLVEAEWREPAQGLAEISKMHKHAGEMNIYAEKLLVEGKSRRAPI
jgi:hypothetical protein